MDQHATPVLLEPLGGTRAAVHRAVQHGTGRVVVAKRAPWDRPDVAAGLRREAGVLGRVAHPSLPRLLDVVEDADGICLVLALATGGSLADRLRTRGPLPPAEAAALGAALAGALAALHDAGVVHRDVHPGNVLFDAELVPILADLDHALDATAAHLATDDEVVGHPDHLDPRLLQGVPAGPASDLYGLGSVVRTAATGRVASDLPDPTSGIPSPPLPGPLATVVDACMSGRLTTASAAVAAFESARLQLAAAAATPHAPAPLRTAPPPVSAPGTSMRAGGGLGTLPPPTVAALRAGAGAVGGISLAAADGGTRRYGPVPARHPRRLPAPARRAGWLLVAVAVVLLPLIGLTAVLLGADGSGPRGSADGAAPGAVPGADGATVAVPPPPCDGSRPEGGALLADLDGVGCSVVVRHADGVLMTPAGSFTLGEAEDVLVVGDWDGDGRWTPGLYRPGTGEVFLFDTAPGDDALVSRPARTHAADGRPVVVQQPDGTHAVEVVTADVAPAV